ncbi:hypothetical protein Taro_032152 [Colocasia esculenta]|uniref:Protein-serine/threonine kinase n=1 Tax=Colocasia esculenta TaxID=4460 RepID=A0A843VKM8_COLES|nr:hypothetical protein [Colocasia esculenta]
MAQLVLPLALSAVKSHGAAAAHLCLFSAGRSRPGLLCRPFRRGRSSLLLGGRRGVSATSTSPVSQPQSRHSKPDGASSVLTFQQAIQRLQRSRIGRIIMQIYESWYAISRDSRENIGLGPFPRSEKAEMNQAASLLRQSLL